MPALLTFEQAADRIAVVDAHNGNVRAAARALNLDHAGLLRSLRTFKQHYGLEPKPRLVTDKRSDYRDADGKLISYWDKRRRERHAPDEGAQLPDPKTIKRISTNTDGEGNVISKWVTEEPQAAQKVNLWREFAAALTSEIPRANPVDAPTLFSHDLCACYPVGDHHLGMLSWHEETDANYDLKIAEDLLNKSIDYLVGASPRCDTALVAFLGDFTHFDSTVAETPAHKNRLDADVRYPKMIRAAIRSMRYLINAVLMRHGKVHVIIEIGNHDPYTSVFLAEALAALYENEPRIFIDRSPSHYHYFHFGKNLIGTHHGHGTKMANLPLIMATDRPKEWGETTHRCWMTGHIHHKQAEDFQGCTVESFRILAAPDAYAAQKGYRPIRDMKAITFHETYGEVGRQTVNPAMFEMTAAG